MSKIVNCDLCSAEMELQSVVPTKKSYKARRYKCPCCDFEKTEFGSGCFDNEDLSPLLPSSVDRDVNKMYRQQERNNERN